MESSYGEDELIFLETEDLQTKTPNNRQILSSTPFTKGKPISLNPYSTASITPIAVKELFLTSPRFTHLSDLSWSSSLNTRVNVDDKMTEQTDSEDTVNIKQKKICEHDNTLGIGSLDLFSQLDETLFNNVTENDQQTTNTTVDLSSRINTSTIREDLCSPLRTTSVDLSLGDLLATPPSRKKRKFAPPPPRRKTSNTNQLSKSAEEDLVTQLTVIENKNKKRKHQHQCILTPDKPPDSGFGSNSTNTELISSHDTSSYSPRTDLKTPVNNLPYIDTPPPSNQSKYSLQTDNQSNYSLQATNIIEEDRRSDQSVFQHQIGGAKSAQRKAQYKPVRPTGLSNGSRSKKCILYAVNTNYTSSTGRSDNQTDEQLEVELLETPETKVRARKINKFKTPQKHSCSEPRTSDGDIEKIHSDKHHHDSSEELIKAFIEEMVDSCIEENGHFSSDVNNPLSTTSNRGQSNETEKLNTEVPATKFPHTASACTATQSTQLSLDQTTKISLSSNNGKHLETSNDSIEQMIPSKEQSSHITDQMVTFSKGKYSDQCHLMESSDNFSHQVSDWNKTGTDDALLSIAANYIDSDSESNSTPKCDSPLLRNQRAVTEIKDKMDGHAITENKNEQVDLKSETSIEDKNVLEAENQTLWSSLGSENEGIILNSLAVSFNSNPITRLDDNLSIRAETQNPPQTDLRKPSTSLQQTSSHNGQTESHLFLQEPPNSVSGNTGGFATASGKKITISDISLQKARGLLETDKNAIDVSTCSKIKCPRITPVKSTVLSFDESPPIAQSTNSNKLYLSSLSSRSLTNSVGFTRASGAKVDISAESLEKARKLMNSEINFTSMEPQTGNCSSKSILRTVSTTLPHTSEFSSADGTPITISKDSLPAARNLPESNSQQNRSEVHTVPQTFQGFSSASGKSIIISKESLEKDKSLMDTNDVLKDELQAPKSSSKHYGFSCDNGKTIAKSSDSLDRADILESSNNISAPKIAPHNSGFSSASGRTISISKESLRQAKKLLDSENNQSESAESMTPKLKGFSSASGKAIQISKESLDKVSGFLNQDPVESEYNNVGFVSASGKKCNISEDSFKMVKSLFDQPDLTPSTSKLPPSKAGFSSAGGKSISVSESSLSRVRSLFNDKNPQEVPQPEVEVCPQIGFLSASSNKVKIKEESLLRVQQLLSENGLDKENLSDISNTMDTNMEKDVTERQVVDVIVDSPHLSTPEPAVKRLRGVFSPINVTPNSYKNRRNFLYKPIHTKPERGSRYSFGNKPFIPHTPPHNSVILQVKNTPVRRSPLINSHSVLSTPDTDTNTKSAESCKPTNMITRIKQSNVRLTWRELTNGQRPAIITDFTLPSSVLDMTSETAVCHTFYNISSEEIVQINKELSLRLNVKQYSNINNQMLYDWFIGIPGIDPSLISGSWFNNHYKWIILKLCSYIRSYPNIFTYNDTLNVCETLKQLKYRYELEIDNCKRSCLKKIYEGDDVTNKPMCLFLSRIQIIQHDSQPDDITAELSDGWYSIQASLDPPLYNLIHDNQLRTGTKLYISQSQLTGIEAGVEPLQAASSARLKINMNSVRRARWDCRLGYHKTKLILPLSTLHPNGGVTSAVECIITRIYPIMYMEKRSDGSKAFYNEVKYKQVLKEKDEEREKLIQREINKMTDSSVNDKKINHSKTDIYNINTGSELYELINNSIDPEYTQMLLTDRQRQLLLDYQTSLHSEQQYKIQQHIYQTQEHNVTPLLKVKLAGLHKSDIDLRSETLMTIWNPPSDLFTLIREGETFRLHNVSVCEVRGQRVSSNILLSANRQTVFEKISISDNIRDLVYECRQVLNIEEVFSCQSDQDVDVMGLVIAWEKINKSLTAIYLSDENGKMIAVNVWGGLETHGLSRQIIEGNIVILNDIKKSSQNRYKLPLLNYTELSSIKNGNTSNRINKLDSAGRKSLVVKCQSQLLKLAQQSGVKNNQQLSNSSHQCYQSNHVTTPLKSALKHVNKRKLESLENSVPEYNDPPLPKQHINTIAITKPYKNPTITDTNETPTSSIMNQSTTATDDLNDEISDSQMMACLSSPN